MPHVWRVHFSTRHPLFAAYPVPLSFPWRWQNSLPFSGEEITRVRLRTFRDSALGMRSVGAHKCGLLLAVVPVSSKAYASQSTQTST